MRTNRDDILVSPQCAVRLFVKAYSLLGNSILTEQRYKVTREAWAVSMFLLSFKKTFNQEWWIKPNVDDTSPDFYCYLFYRDNSNRFTSRYEMPVDVFDWFGDEYSSFEDAVINLKLKKINYPQLTLLCNVRKNTTINNKKINLAINKIRNLNIKDIWYLGNVLENGSRWRVTQLYPNITCNNEIDYNDILTTKEKNSFITCYKGFSNDIIYESRNEKIVLDFEFNFHDE